MNFDIGVLRNNIENLCRKQGITLNAMAEGIGVRQSTLSGIMHGRSNNPTILVLWKIADFF
jgi:transcriptional regulator with XRE-family HTH domain